MRKFGIIILIIALICGMIAGIWFYSANHYVVSKAETEECEKIAIDIYNSNIDGLETLKIYSDIIDKNLRVSIDGNEITFSDNSKNYYYAIAIIDGEIENTNLRYSSKAIYMSPIIGMLVFVFIFIWGLIIAAIMNNMNKDAFILVLVSLILVAVIFACIVPGLL